MGNVIIYAVYTAHIFSPTVRSHTHTHTQSAERKKCTHPNDGNLLARLLCAALSYTCVRTSSGGRVHYSLYLGGASAGDFVCRCARVACPAHRLMANYVNVTIIWNTERVYVCVLACVCVRVCGRTNADANDDVQLNEPHLLLCCHCRPVSVRCACPTGRPVAGCGTGVLLALSCALV